MLFWTSEATTIHLLNAYGTFIGLTEEEANALTDAQVYSLGIGSKALFSAWISYICLIWCLKGSVLFFYNRLTKGLKEQRLVRWLAIGVGASFLAMILQILLNCRPIHRNWQIKPYAGDQCTLIYVRYYLLLILNVSTDLGLMIFIPAPILWKAQIPIKRKIMVAILLFSSLFIVTAAIIRCIMSVGDIRRIGTSGAWAIRETFVSMFVVNAPAIKPLFSRRRLLAQGSKSGGSASRTGTSKPRHTQRGDEVELRSNESWSNKDEASVRDLEHGSSGGSVHELVDAKNDGLRINVTKAFTTSSEEASQTQENQAAQYWGRAEGSLEDNKMRNGWKRLGEQTRGMTRTTVIADTL
ncbi:uncharacterized protein LTHEOB_9422 [Lasiodiplodia theobromae]|uniref:uncharacterized protein n=1 Tax=Lasiodiplodia theobromae TaxID=45133 RepID=UPI0015C37DA2|nr:uncharacterized protein LTHEOB_9422 [Lasiodiplodia theobromae]KAF4540326.1 hypothetical protein LTHEOB_9422 [Lasiodiplodia theobromae]